MTHVRTPDPADFPELTPERAARWSQFGRWDPPFFPQVVGLEVEEVREDYARMRLPYRPELNQPAGVMHGGALATLVDTVVVPAIAGAYDEMPMMLTLSLGLQFLSAVHGEDVIGEGWITRRGRGTVFCEALIRTASGEPVVTGQTVYAVREVPS